MIRTYGVIQKPSRVDLCWIGASALLARGKIHLRFDTTFEKVVLSIRIGVRVQNTLLTLITPCAVLWIAASFSIYDGLREDKR